MTTTARVKALIKECIKYKHVEKLQSARLFFEDVLRYMHEDMAFHVMVAAQLNLYCDGHLSAHDVYATMNQSTHRIRNAMITWYIDHPGSPKPE